MPVTSCGERLAHLPHSSVVYDRISDIAWISIGTDGVAAAAIGLILLMAWRSAIQSGRSIPGFITLVATFVAVGILRWPLLPVVFCIAPLSIAASLYWEKKRAR